MPTDKPRIQALVTKDTYKKFKKLCEREQRSESNFSGYIITKYIADFENEHGVIEIKEEPAELK